MEAAKENLASVYEAVADAAGDGVALIRGARHVSWRELDARAARLAAHFEAARLKPGDRVVLALYNAIEYFEALYAACKARLVPVNINYRASPKEMLHFLERSEAAAIVFHRSLAASVGEAAAAYGKLRRLIHVADDSNAALPAGSVDYAEAIANSAPTPRQARSADDQLIMFTGGTTGLPKAVLWRHRDVIALLGRNSGAAGATAAEFGANAARIREAGAAAINYVLPPMMHSTGLFSVMGALLSGNVAMLSASRALDPELVWREVEREKADSLVIVGDVFARPLNDALRQWPREEAQRRLASLKTVRSVGVRWSADAKAELLDYGDCTLLDVLASTEGGAVVSWETKRSDGAVATRFTLMPHAWIMDENGERIELGSGKTGIVVSAGILPDGYIGERADGASGTFRVIEGKRVVVTGDYARAETDGSITLIGRGSSVINTGGEKVYADEVEKVIASHADVVDVIVAGVPDPRWGHLIAAVVALRPGATATPSDLIDLVGAELAGYKKPRHIRIVERIERKATGKADRQWAAALLSESARSS
jgi:3-oxocholest-4-en-26-oate---CoA ligase